MSWLALKLDAAAPARLALQAAADPQAARAAIAGLVGKVAELDCDIVIDPAPDSLTPQIEQFQRSPRRRARRC